MAKFINYVYKSIWNYIDRKSLQRDSKIFKFHLVISSLLFSTIQSKRTDRGCKILKLHLVISFFLDDRGGGKVRFLNLSQTLFFSLLRTRNEVQVVENAKGIAFPATWSRSNSVLRSDGRRCNVLSNLLTTWTFTRRWDARIPPRVQETRCGCARAPRFPPMNIIRLVIFATHETPLPSPFLGDGDTRCFLLRPPRSFQFFQPRGKGWANNSWSGVRCARIIIIILRIPRSPWHDFSKFSGTMSPRFYLYK